MMKIKSTTLSLVAATLLTGFGVLPAMAQSTSTHGIDRQQQEIRAQVQQGIASGRITPQEAQELYQRERDIQFREIRIKNDGNATQQEREALRRDLDAMRADVDRKLNNNRVVGRDGDNTPGIDNLAANIHARIERGIASGRITKAEAQRLHQRERDIQRREAKFKADRVVTRAERDELQRSLNKLSQDVDRLLNNERQVIYR